MSTMLAGCGAALAGERAISALPAVSRCLYVSKRSAGVSDVSVWVQDDTAVASNACAGPQQQQWQQEQLLLGPSLLAQLHAAVGAVLALPQPSSINSQLNVSYGRQPRRLGGGSANTAPPLMAAAHPSDRGLLLQHSRCVATLRPYKSAPTPLPRYRKPDKNRRMNRMVIHIPPQVQVAVCDGELRLAGKAGSTALGLSFLDPTGLVAWQCYPQSMSEAAEGPGSGSLLLLASPSTRCWRGIQTHVNNAVHGVMQGYLIGVTVQGVGYRLEPVPDETVAAALAARRGDAATSKRQRIIWEKDAEKSTIAYPHKAPSKAVRLKVGYTRACIFPLPEGVLAFFVKPTLMYLYGIDKAVVHNTAAALRAVRSPNAYTGNGVQIVGEELDLKKRASTK